MYKCPNCGQEMIDKKDTCVNCGCKLTKEKKGISVGLLLIIFGALVIIGALVCFGIANFGTDKEIEPYLPNNSTITNNTETNNN